MRYMSLEIITLEGYKKKCFMLLHVPLSTSDKELQKAKKKKKKKKKKTQVLSLLSFREDHGTIISKTLNILERKLFFMLVEAVS